MNKTRRQIDCLQRLEELTTCRDEIFAFLFDEKLITKEEIKDIKSTSNPSQGLHVFLAKLSSDNKIQLLEYEWQLLPVERIKLLILTDRNNKEFSYNF